MNILKLNVLLLFILGAILGIIPEFINPGFYFIDDMQHEFMPVFYNIGRTLHTGSFPILSLSNWLGGNYFAEYQYALINPVSLALYYVLPFFSSLAVAAAFLAAFFQGLLFCGAFYLARAYGIERAGAYLAALVITTNNFIAYWYATSWFPALVSIAWLLCAWAALIHVSHSRKHWLCTIFLCYLTMTSGWPQTTLLLGLISILIFFQKWRENRLNDAIRVVIALSAATLLSSPCLIALLSVGEIAARSVNSVNSNLWVPSLQDILNFSFPLHLGYIKGFNGYQLMATPYMYCAWFILPLLPFIKWGRQIWLSSANATLLALGFFLLLACLGPEQIGPVRWPFRFLPYLHIVITVLILKNISNGGLFRVNRIRLILSTGLVALSLLLSWQRIPLQSFDSPVFILAIEGVIVTFLTVVAWQNKKFYGYAALIATTFGIFVFTRMMFSSNTDYANWGMNPQRNDNALVNTVPQGYTAYSGKVGLDSDGNRGRLDPQRLLEFQTGFMSLEYGLPSLGGYSPLGHKALQKELCMVGIFGETLPCATNRLFEIDKETGAPLADLFRIQKITAMRGLHLSALKSERIDSWNLEFSGNYTERYVRDLPNISLPGTVSWTSPNLTVIQAAIPQPLEEHLEIQREKNSDAKVIFARLWWPGYTASFAGKEIPVTAHRGIFVTAILPTEPQSGILKLVYRPPYFLTSLILVGLGFLITLIGCFWKLLIRRWDAKVLTH